MEYIYVPGSRWSDDAYFVFMSDRGKATARYCERREGRQDNQTPRRPSRSISTSTSSVLTHDDRPSVSRIMLRKGGTGIFGFHGGIQGGAEQHTASLRFATDLLTSMTRDDCRDDERTLHYMSQARRASAQRWLLTVVSVVVATRSASPRYESRTGFCLPHATATQRQTLTPG